MPATDDRPVGHRAAQRRHIAEVLGDGIGHQTGLAATLLGEQWCVDVRSPGLGDIGEEALEGSQLPDRDVVLGDLTAHVDVELHRDGAGDRR